MLWVASPASIDVALLGVMHEVGLELLPPQQDFAHEVLRSSTVNITVGCSGTCARLPPGRTEDWPLEHPANRPLDQMRQIRDDARALALALVARDRVGR